MLFRSFKPVAAISVGLFDGTPMLDLCYKEDSNADVDMNIIMDNSFNLVEIQGTAEGKNFSRTQLNQLIDLGEKGIKEIIQFQKQLLNLQ